MPRALSAVRLLVYLGVAGAPVILSSCHVVERGARAPLPVVEGATLIGTDTCLGCHPWIADAYKGTPHARPVTGTSDGCETCHGAGSEHLASLSRQDMAGAREKILTTEALRALEPGSRSALCLRCHARDVSGFAQSEHSGAGVSCWDCHANALHTPPPVTPDSLPVGEQETVDHASTGPLLATRPGADEASLCYRCHGEIEGQFLLQFHHPVPEKRMRCTDCHAVHGGGLSIAADGEKERCLSCHEEIRGPFIFEHLALEEGCVVCHSPHGSIVEKLLVQANNGLCEQCHFDARFPLIGGVNHTRLLFGGALCYDCHFQVHGSNTDENLLPLRIEQLLRQGG